MSTEHGDRLTPAPANGGLSTGTPSRLRAGAGGLAAVILCAAVVLANWLTSRYHFVPVGFGQMATAGTFAAGAALAARDALQDLIGKPAMLGALALAGALSFIVADPKIAAASTIAFAVSELADFAVYTPIRRVGRFGDRWWATAVVVSGAAGAIVDTAIFIGIAFGAAAILPAMVGQLIGKTYASLAYALLGRASGVVLRQPDRRCDRA